MRGNWAVIGMDVLFVFFFTKVLGGYRIGYMRLSDIVLSQVLAVLLAMVVSYFEVCMVANDYMNPRPLLLMTLTEIIFIVPWVCLVRKFYQWLYPPRQMLVIYGNYSPDDLIDKINPFVRMLHQRFQISCFVVQMIFICLIHRCYCHVIRALVL